MRSLGQVDITSNVTEKTKTEVIAVVVVDKEPISKTVENSVDIFVHEELTLIKFEFDKIIQKDLLDSYAIDDLRDIQCLIDEARKAEDSQLDLHRKIDKILDKVDKAISKSKIFLEKYNHKENLLALDQVFGVIKTILTSCQEKLDAFGKRLKFIKSALIPITKIGHKIEEDSSKKVYKEWAEAFERFAEGLEECFEIYNDIPLENIEKFAKELFSLASKKSYNNFRKDEYKRRLRFSANYIIKIIAEKRPEINHESIEEKKVFNTNSCKDNYEKENPWKLVMGQKTYQELLAESQRKIHLLDELEPKTEIDTKNQLDTLDYLQKELRCR